MNTFTTTVPAVPCSIGDGLICRIYECDSCTVLRAGKEIASRSREGRDKFQALVGARRHREKENARGSF